MSVRRILWSQAAVVCYTGAVVHLDRVGVLNFWTIRGGVNVYSPLGELVWDSVGVLYFGVFLFPPLVVVALCLARPPRPIFTSVLAEILLLIGHWAALLPAVM